LGLSFATISIAATPTAPAGTAAESDLAAPIVPSVDTDLRSHQGHLATIAKTSRRGGSLNLPKMNLALELISATGDADTQARYQQAALRLVSELPPNARSAFARELREMKSRGGELGNRAALLLSALNAGNGSRPAVPPSAEAGAEIDAIYSRLRQLRASRSSACPSEATLQLWNQTIDASQVADGAGVVSGQEQVRASQADYRKAEQQALGAESTYRQTVDRATRGNDLAYFNGEKDRVFHQRDQLRRQTEQLLQTILPAPGGSPRSLHDNLAAASSIVPVFSQFQRKAPLWRYPGIDVASNQAAVSPETYAALDNPANQRYFVESLTEHTEPGFLFTLTEAGKRALSRDFFPLEKIAVHRLGELDAAEQRSAALFQEEDRVYAAEKTWKAHNPKLVDRLNNTRQQETDRASGMVTAQQSLALRETDLQGAQQRLQRDRALRATLSNCRPQAASLDGALRNAHNRDLMPRPADGFSRPGAAPAHAASN
jgi:hypothetical protein